MIDSENYSLNHTHWFIGIVLCAFVLLLGCNRLSDQEEQFFSQASENAKLANEGLRRSNRYMNAWLEKADTETGLIPRNLGDSRDVWNAKDAAADNYPFMVLTASITNNELYKGRLTDMLRTEERLTSRLGALPDTWSFKKDDFASGRPDTADIIFGASEYIKDGLLPLTEWLGESVWSDRMLHMMDDIWKYASVSTEYGKIPSENVEINGEMLQALPRLYYMKDEDKYLDWAVRLGNYYLLGDGYKSLYQKDIRLRDHGCEIISGLCELYCCVSFSRSDLKEKYKAPLYRLLDRILAVRETGTESLRVVCMQHWDFLDDATLASVGQATPALDQTRRLATLAADAGVTGLVCSPVELPAVRAEVGSGMTLVVPGIRPAGSAAGDQRRTASPAETRANGADVLVVGRPVTRATDPGAAARELAGHAA